MNPSHHIVGIARRLLERRFNGEYAVKRVVTSQFSAPPTLGRLVGGDPDEDKAEMLPTNVWMLTSKTDPLSGWIHVIGEKHALIVCSQHVDKAAALGLLSADDEIAPGITHPRRWGSVGGFIHVPPATNADVLLKPMKFPPSAGKHAAHGPLAGIALYANSDRAYWPKALYLKPRQTIACSFLEKAAFTPEGSRKTGYFGPDGAVGVQLRCAEPLAAYTDDAYSGDTEVQMPSSFAPSVATAEGLLTWARLKFESEQRVTNVDRYVKPGCDRGRHGYEEVHAGSVRVGIMTICRYCAKTEGMKPHFTISRPYEPIRDPVELIARTGEKKGLDPARFGGTRRGEVKGIYVHYNEVLLPTDHRLGQNRVVQCFRHDGVVHVVPLTGWRPTEFRHGFSRAAPEYSLDRKPTSKHLATLLENNDSMARARLSPQHT